MQIKVNGIEVEHADIDTTIAERWESFKEYCEVHEEAPDREKLREWIIEELVETEVLRQASLEMPEPSQTRIKQELNNNTEFYQELPEDQQTVIASAQLRIQLVMNRWLKELPQITESDARQYYDDNQNDFMQPEALVVSNLSMLVHIENRMDKYRLMLDIKSQVERGDLEWIHAVLNYSETLPDDLEKLFNLIVRGESGWLPEAEDALFKLEIGQLSDVIEMQVFLLNLFRVEQVFPAKLLTFQEARKRIFKHLKQEAEEDLIENKIDDLIAKAKVEII